MTTATIDQTACPAWCAGPDWHGQDTADDPEFHQDHSRHLHVRGFHGYGADIDPDYQTVSVSLSQQVAPGSTPTIALSCRDDADGKAHTSIEGPGAGDGDRPSAGDSRGCRGDREGPPQALSAP